MCEFFHTLSEIREDDKVSTAFSNFGSFHAILKVCEVILLRQQQLTVSMVSRIKKIERPRSNVRRVPVLSRPIPLRSACFDLSCNS